MDLRPNDKTRGCAVYPLNAFLSSNASYIILSKLLVPQFGKRASAGRNSTPDDQQRVIGRIEGKQMDGLGHILAGWRATDGGRDQILAHGDGGGVGRTGHHAALGSGTFVMSQIEYLKWLKWLGYENGIGTNLWPSFLKDAKVEKISMGIGKGDFPVMTLYILFVIF
jgi:hypothetical protein